MLATIRLESRWPQRRKQRGPAASLPAPGRRGWASSRHTESQIADSLNTTEIYSVVRHPLYPGNYLIGLGSALVLWVWWLPVIYTLVFCVYYERIMFAEEAFLCRTLGEEFQHWSAKTPAFWPQFSQWRRPALPFSRRTVLRREYSGMLVVILGHSGLEFGEHAMLRQAYRWQSSWFVFTIGGAMVYLLLRALKKRTTLLDVMGR